MTNQLWLIIETIISSTAFAALTNWLLNRRQSRLQAESLNLDNDEKTVKLINELQATILANGEQIIALRREVRELNAEFEALMLSVKKEPYDVAERIITRARETKRAIGG